jgi:TRAP-type C4-dicarboxylate transport system substrate-binding protein
LIFRSQTTTPLKSGSGVFVSERGVTRGGGAIHCFVDQVTKTGGDMSIRCSFGRALATAMLAVGSLAVDSLTMASPSRAQPVTLVIGTGSASDTPSSMAMEIFRDEVARRSHDAISIELSTDRKLGGVLDIAQKVRAGAVFATWLPATYLSRVVPELEVLNLPFVFDNYDEVQQLLDGPTGRLVEARLDAKGFTVLLWMDYGGRSVMNAKRPLKTPDDFKNLKLRLGPLEILHATFRAFGTATFNTDTKDTYMGLQQGLFDGIDAPYSIMNSFGFADNQKYVSDTRHLIDPEMLVANKRAFNNLPPEDRRILREASKVAGDRERKMSSDIEAAALAALQARGLQFDPLPRETRTALRKTAAGVINGMKGRIDAELVDRVMTEIAGR